MPAPAAMQNVAHGATPTRGLTDDSTQDAAVPRGSRRQPAATAVRCSGARGPRGRPDRRRRAARDRGREHPRRGAHAGGRGPAVGDRRRVPPRLVAHGLHLPARRHHAGRRGPRRAVPERRGDDRVHAVGRARRGADRARAHDLRRRVRVPAVGHDDGAAEAHDPLAEHGALPGRACRDQRRRVSRSRRVLGRPDGRLRRGGHAPAPARLHLPPARRHDARLPERPAAACPRRRDRRRRRAPARGLHPQHQPRAREPARRACR